MIYPITAKHFRSFCDELAKLKSRWEMSGWRMTAAHCQLADDVWAMCNVDLEGRSVHFRLNTETDTAFTDAWARHCARHEMAHAILEPLQTMAGRRTVTQDQITAAEHEVIQRLMGLLPK